MTQTFLIRTRSLLRALLVLLLVAGGATAAAAKADPSIQGFVDKVNQASTNLMAAGPGASAECRRLLGWAFDLQGMARFALDSAWKTASPSERREFLDAFENEVVAAYLRRVRAYRGASMSFAGERAASGGDRYAASRVTMPNGSDQTWVWRLRRSGGSWRVVDLSIDGRSALRSERDDYRQILQQNNGDIGAVIDFVRQRSGQGRRRS